MARPYERYRELLLQSAPWCAKCAYEPEDTSKLQYHHLFPQSLGGDHSEGVLLCKTCHDEESAEQRRAHKQIGFDGYRINDVNPFKPRKKYRKRQSVREDHWC